MARPSASSKLHSADAKAYQRSDHRGAELPLWLHRYNWHRPHGIIGAKPPISKLGLTGQPTHIAIDGHLSKTGKRRKTAVDGRATRHSYDLSQRCRKRIEEVLGWIKSSAGLAKVKLRGRTGWTPPLGWRSRPTT